MYPQTNPIYKVDQTFLIIYSLSAVVLLGITVAIIYFLFRYNKKRHPEPSDIKGNFIAEFLWTVIPTILMMWMFYAGWNSYKALRSVPKNAYEVQVEAKMWSWKFTYPNGRVSNELFVPVGRPVKLNITTVDVIHSFYVPAFRIKMDAVPGLTTYAWFNADKKGEYDILCAEYCGLRHAYMLSKVKIVDEKEFALFLEGGNMVKSAKVTLPDLLKKYGCADCHALDGSVLVGPALNDILGRKNVVVSNGKEREIVVDKEYIANSIVEPEKDIVKGYDPIMPSYKKDISEDELKVLVNLLAGEGEVSKLDGRELAENEGCLGCHSTDGSIIAGPTFKGLYGSKRKVKKDSETYELEAYEDYIYVSIKYPAREIVDDFDPIMPNYETLTDEQVNALIEYIKSLK